jgi:hypothetical protein
MSKTLKAKQWGKAAASWGPEFFQIRVLQEKDVDRLREAVKYEAQHKARQKRIATLNKQIQKRQEIEAND